MVDVVLSDMCEPWEQTTGFWKRSLSDPYIRMMNTTGIKFSDHAGSMVCLSLLCCCFFIFEFAILITYVMLCIGSLRRGITICIRYAEDWGTFRL